MDRLREDVVSLQRAVEELKTATVEHRVRLENGTAVFATQDDRLKAVEHRITPKPPSIPKVVSITFGVFFVLAGALWALSMMLSNRPTTLQLRTVMHDHEKHGHEQTRLDMSELRYSIGEQKALIKDVQSKQGTIQTAVGENKKRLDTLLRRRGR